MQQLRQGAEWNPLIENMFQLNVAPRNCVADYYQIGCGIEIFDGKRLRNGNAQRRKEIRHRRIGRCIRSGDGKASLSQHSGERRHRGAANANEVDMFECSHLKSALSH